MTIEVTWGWAEPVATKEIWSWAEPAMTKVSKETQGKISGNKVDLGLIGTTGGFGLDVTSGGDRA